MKIYPLNDKQRSELVALNTNNATWGACYYPNIGVAIEQATLDNPEFANHKALFDSWKITEYVEIDNNGYENTLRQSETKV